MCMYPRAIDNSVVEATTAVPRHGLQRRGRSRLSGSVVLLALACGLVLPLLLSVRVQAQVVQAPSDCGSKAYLDNLPVPPPKDPNVKRQVQLVNCTDQVILGAANAAHEANHPPYPVFPQDGTWVMQPYPSGSNANVLTIDIPPQWYGQFKSGGVGRTSGHEPAAVTIPLPTGPSAKPAVVAVNMIAAPPTFHRRRRPR